MFEHLISSDIRESVFVQCKSFIKEIGVHLQNEVTFIICISGLVLKAGGVD